MAGKGKKINFWEDPIFQAFYNPMMEQGLASRNAEQARLKNLRTDVFGVGGTIAQNQLAAINDQNRIAEEMAYRGGLYSGAYRGPEKGLGSQSQSDYALRDFGIKQKYNAEVNPDNLREQGLKMNPDGSISPLAPGETISWTNPATGKTEQTKYDWGTHTAAGRQAKQAALAQYALATAKTRI